ncbi:MAG: DUF445 domain-containing protein, partial [Novosphingobium sp.]
MRLFATGLLVAMAALFLLARMMVHTHPVWPWLLSFSEAAMVGGLADWFAVTALFRRPLGLPIPHTAIVPENKDRIADAMADFIRDNFLTPEVIARRMMAMNLAAAAGEFLAAPERGSRKLDPPTSKPQGAGERDGVASGSALLVQTQNHQGSRLRSGAANLFADMLQSLDPEQLGGLVKKGLKGQLEKLDIAPLLGGLLDSAIADGRHMPLMDGILRWAGVTLEANEDLLRQLIHERANGILRWTGLDERLTSAILDGLFKLIAECIVVPDHPVRLKVEEGLEHLAQALKSDPEMHDRVNRLKLELLANPAMTAWLDALWERARTRLLAVARDPNGALSGQVGESLAELGGALQRDANLQRLVNRFARRTLVGIASRYGNEIVRLISETVKRWDAS